MNILSTSLPGSVVGKSPDLPTGERGHVLIVRCFYLIRLLQKELLAGLALCIIKWTKLMNERSLGARKTNYYC